MKGYKAKSIYGLAEANKYTTIFMPTKPHDNTKYFCVFSHGSGAPYGQVDVTRQYTIRYAPLLASAGIPVIASEFADQAWANDAAQAAITNCVTYMGNNYGLPTNKYLLLGASMGGATVIRHASLNPAKVAAMVGLIPLCNINNFYPKQVSATIDEIASAWGVAAHRTGADFACVAGSNQATSAALAFTAADVGSWIVQVNLPAKTKITAVNGNTITMSANALATANGVTAVVANKLPAGAAIETLGVAMNGVVPSRLYYSDGDTTVDPADQIAMGPIIGSEAVIDVGPNGHTETTLGDIINYGAGNLSDIISFFKRHGG